MSKTKEKKSVGIIPARYASTRLPGKPLLDIAGKTMIQRVYEQAKKSNLSEVVVATDDKRIQKVVEDFGGKVVLTGQQANGTDRCAAALQQLITQGKQYEIVVNIQGDEPFVAPSQINSLLELHQQSNTVIATLAKKIEAVEVLLNPNMVKVVLSQSNKALYFSRNGIPFLRDVPLAHWLEKQTYYQHVGLYAFSPDFLLYKLPNLPDSNLAIAEQLEQLQWLDGGFAIQVALTDLPNIGVDTPADLERAIAYAKEHSL